MESLEPLRNLTNLTNLSVSNGGMVDGAFNSLEPLSGLTNLQSLSVRVRPANDLVDLSPLSGLTQLNTLYIATDQNDHVTASNLGALSGLTNLSSLELHVNNLTDISAPCTPDKPAVAHHQRRLGDRRLDPGGPCRGGE